MKYYYVGKNTTLRTTTILEPLFQQFHIGVTENIDKIMHKIRELDANNTPIGRGILDTDIDVINHIREHVTIYDEMGGIIVGVLTFFIQNRELCIDTLCTPYIPIAKNVGGELLDTAKQIMRTLKLDNCNLASTKTAVGFYKKHGFEYDNSGTCDPEYKYVDMIFWNRLRTFHKKH